MTEEVSFHTPNHERHTHPYVAGLRPIWAVKAVRYGSQIPLKDAKAKVDFAVSTGQEIHIKWNPRQMPSGNRYTKRDFINHMAQSGLICNVDVEPYREFTIALRELVAECRESGSDVRGVVLAALDKALAES